MILDFNQGEKLWVEHVEEFVKYIKQNQHQIKSGMKLGTKDAHFVDCSCQLKTQDVFAVKQF